MSALISTALQYRIAIFYGVLFSLNALFTAIIASFMNTEWSSLTETKKFLLVILILQNWTGVLIAFLNQTISRITNGGPILPAEIAKQP